MLNGGAHHSLEVEAELRIRPLPYVFKDTNARRISQEAIRGHFGCRLERGCGKVKSSLSKHALPSGRGRAVPRGRVRAGGRARGPVV